MKARRRRTTIAAMLLLGAAACTAGGGGSTSPPSVNVSAASNKPVTITIWTPWTGREYRQWRSIFAGFETQYPWISVETVPGVVDNKVVAAINSGSPPDVVESFTTDNVGKFCSSGAFQDLGPYIQQDGLDLKSTFLPASLQYTSFQGVQCALPFMSDVWGLYYNKDLFQQAGITGPPRTMSELTADAKKLTVFNPDGSIKVAGFVPSSGYGQNTAANLGHSFGASWYNDDGTSAIATDPAWKAMLAWQNDLVDFYGADNLARFVAGAGNEFSSANDFQRGRVAMIMDGEWRVAFIADGAPTLNYATAPFPAADDRPDLYGSGAIGGDLLGIPRGSPNPAEAWLLLKYMATDTASLVSMANSIRNVPTTLASLQSPDLDAPAAFRTFLDIAANPASSFKQPSLIGSADQELFGGFLEKWQAGKVSDLQAGLQQVASQIDDQIQQAQGP